MYLKDYFYELFRNLLLNLNSKLIKDIYVITLFIEIEDDPRKPIVKIGYNTKQYFLKSIKEAFDQDEAKWDYAYYIENAALIIGDNEEEKNRITQFIKDNNLYFTDQKLDQN